MNESNTVITMCQDFTCKFFSRHSACRLKNIIINEDHACKYYESRKENLNNV